MCQNPNPSSGPNPDPSTSSSICSATPTSEEQRRRGDFTKQALVQDLARRLSAADLSARVQAAREVRKFARASAKSRSSFAAASVVQPLIAMLPSPDHDAQEAALLALLNLAVRNEGGADEEEEEEREGKYSPSKVRPSDEDRRHWVGEPDVDRKATAFIAKFHEARFMDLETQTSDI